MPAPVETVPLHDEVSNDDGGVHAIAEAYPHAPEDAPAAAPVTQEEKLLFDQANDVIPPQSDDQPAVLEFVTTEDIPKTTVAPALIPAKKKKVIVALQPVLPEREPKVTRQDDDEEEYEEDEVPFFAKPQKRKNSNQTPYSIFPLNFGNTYGGAIAVANSFSTSKGGATSHAIAYGSPAPKKSYKRLIQQQQWKYF